MGTILSQAVERLSNPEVLFGLGVRFFGVFIVLIIVMVVLQFSGWLFQTLDRRRDRDVQPPAGGTAPGTPASSRTTSPTEPAASTIPSEVPGEVAAAVAMALEVPEEAAVAVTLALADATGRSVATVPLPSSRMAGSLVREEPGTAWRLLGRQQALWRKTSLARHTTPAGE